MIMQLSSTWRFTRQNFVNRQSELDRWILNYVLNPEPDVTDAQAKLKAQHRSKIKKNMNEVSSFPQVSFKNLSNIEEFYIFKIKRKLKEILFSKV